ncbi:hypothetical protein B005_4603 [Nocardiopsis alba ATCC BAA-2165]|uniref:Uncharacterized protein n=1 Tax=Nocardiopsis alba (strain ATCC BAA-2165 / BE74) TaxID=1205910 RepID=J7LJ43_NOCAA|nr:hypothetical protein B005_4603 [Nocardiopsis alba ATCC BAA-2165]
MAGELSFPFGHRQNKTLWEKSQAKGVVSLRVSCCLTLESRLSYVLCHARE